MSDEDRGRRGLPAAEGHPGATVLQVEAVGLVLVAAACLEAGAVLTAAVALVLAAVAGGLATSIAEGFPGSAAAIVAFEGVTLAAVTTPRSVLGASAILAVTAFTWCWMHYRGNAQIRRPVSCQYTSRSTRL